MAIWVGVNMLQFCSVSNSLSNTTLSNKGRGIYFLKDCLLVVIIVYHYDFACIWVYNKTPTTFISLLHTTKITIYILALPVHRSHNIKEHTKNNRPNILKAIVKVKVNKKKVFPYSYISIYDTGWVLTLSGRWGLRIYCPYHLQRCKTLPKIGVVDMILICGLWWGSSSGALRSVEYPLIAITPRSTLTWSDGIN